MNLLTLSLLQWIAAFGSVSAFLLTPTPKNTIFLSSNKILSTKLQENAIQVTVERELPTLSSPIEARNAWLSYVWEKGGGLPIFVLLRDSLPIQSEKGTEFKTRRLILPAFMEEEIIVEDEDKSNVSKTKSTSIQYKVTKPGLLSTEIVTDSHSGTVTFRSINDAMTMKWDVEFEATNPSRQSLWKTITNQMIKDASDNFVSSIAVPKLYTRRTRLITKNGLTPEQAMEEWMNFCWKEGAGLLPPIISKDKKRLIVPPFLKERIISCNVNQAQPFDSDIQYTVDNPGFTTYQVHSHLGRIQFIPVSNNTKNNEPSQVDMLWEVEIRPYRNWSRFIQFFTSFIITAYARNFKCYLKEGPDAMVSLKPPRGYSGKSIMQVRKDSWLGGVLFAHLNDNRSVYEQTVSMFQPWTWGRSEDDVDVGEGEEWVDGFLTL